MNDWLMGFQADVIGVPVRRPRIVETTALGAAGLAGLTVGVWGSPDDFRAAQGDGRRFEPDGGGGLRSERISQWRRAVRATVGWAEDTVSSD